MSDFEAAALKAKQLSGLPDEQLLNLYKLFKQATVGDINTSRPGMLDLKGKKKWDAWESVKGLSSDDAKAQYCALVSKLSS